ncbi:four helix bundle protein [Rubinisphaera italica]|uniref:Four helix bundle protein n=1 Tax=Rubinisphaera italica TaxID=2527969 RepID=A0A5C5XP86_9PLAN|nr:four helix bundle protein [Rubinisphaera italica]TWT64488.1 hypothetical protein Pan54_52520 [Rubinisphaera italica]
MSGEMGYRDLLVWSKAMTLVEEVYKFSTQFPSSEQFGLTSQIRRAAVSVPSNIAEGYGRGGGDYRRHVNIARGSLMEVETQMELSVRLNFCDRETVKSAWHLSQEVGKMLTKLGHSLKKL